MNNQQQPSTVQDIRAALTLLVAPGDVLELRLLKLDNKKATGSGYFADLDKAAQLAARYDTQKRAAGIYATLNPVDPALRSRAAERIEERAEATTKDQDIVRLRWLPIDADPVRPTGISATNEEHAAAHERVCAIRDWLEAAGWPKPIYADSGNGAHLLYRVDLPNDKANADLIQQCLGALALEFDDTQVKVDTSVFNAARIWKLYGTTARKGDNTLERPHRRAAILTAPEFAQPVDLALLRTLARRFPDMPEQHHKPSNSGSITSNISGWMDGHGWTHHIKHNVPLRGGAGTLYIFDECPFNPDHKDARITQFSNGAVQFGCYHNSCQGNDWKVLRAKYEPKRIARNSANNYRNSTSNLRMSEQSDLPVPEAEPLNSANIANIADKAEAWEDIKPFDEQELPIFPVHVLPAWGRDFVIETAISTQTPVDLAGLLCLSMISLAIQKKIVIRIKDDYLEPVNTYSAVVLAPGNRKSPVFNQMVAPAVQFERAEAERTKPRRDQIKAEREIKEARLEHVKREAAKAPPGKLSALVDEAKQLTADLAALVVPPIPQLFTTDATPEKLVGLLAEHNGRMGILGSEGGVFDTLAGRYNSGIANIDAVLCAWSGDTLKVDRQGRDPQVIYDPALTLALTVQPDVINALAHKPGFRGRGLIGRFLFAVPRSRLGEREIDPRAVSEESRDTYHRSMLGLFSIPYGCDLDGQQTPHALQISTAGRLRWLQFAAELEPQLHPHGALGAMTDWAGKLAGTVARLAALLHVAEHVQSGAPWDIPVTPETVTHAIEIGRYLIPHARAAYGMLGADGDSAAAKHVLAWMARNEYRPFKRNEVHDSLKGRSGFEKVEQVQTVLDFLEERNYIRPRHIERPEGQRGRKPSPTYDINPQIYSQNTENSEEAHQDAVNVSAEILAEYSENSDQYSQNSFGEEQYDGKAMIARLRLQNTAPKAVLN